MILEKNLTAYLSREAHYYLVFYWSPQTFQVSKKSESSSYNCVSMWNEMTSI